MFRCVVGVLFILLSFAWFDLNVVGLDYLRFIGGSVAFVWFCWLGVTDVEGFLFMLGGLLFSC